MKLFLIMLIFITEIIGIKDDIRGYALITIGILISTIAVIETLEKLSDKLLKQSEK